MVHYVMINVQRNPDYMMINVQRSPDFRGLSAPTLNPSPDLS